MPDDENLEIDQNEDAEFDAGWDTVAAETPPSDEPDLDEIDDVSSDAGEQPGGEDEVADLDDDFTGKSNEELSAELKKVTQKLRSAQGRLHSTGKLETQVEELTRQKDELLALISQGKPVATSKGGDRGATSESGDEEEVIPSGYSREEWEAFKEDFPVQAKREVEREKEMRELRSETESVKKTATDAAAKTARADFLKPILEKHPDYHAIEQAPGDLIAFVEDQSPALKRAYMDVIRTGSQEEIIDLLDQFKASQTPPDTKGEEKGQPSSNGKPQAKAEKALATKSQSKSSPNLSKKGIDMDDFDAGWDEASK